MKKINRVAFYDTFRVTNILIWFIVLMFRLSIGPFKNLVVPVR